jgi:quinol monooxygenase YgiN
MSVLVTMRVPGDTDEFRRFIDTDAEFMQRLGSEAKAQGAIHHRFGVGDGFVVVVDEWESAEAFQKFFQRDDIAQAILRAGAQGEPEITVTEAIETPDQF